MGKHVLIATGIGFVALWILGLLIFGLLLSGTMADLMAGAGDCVSMEPNMVLITLATLIQALFLALVLDKFNASTLKSGAIAAAWVTALISLMMGVWFLMMYPHYGNDLLAFDVLTGVVHAAIGGGIIGWALGKFK
jgi:hypothetical protein